jgi:hypothetical protein
MALPFIAFNVHFGGEFLPATREGRDRTPACLGQRADTGGVPDFRGGTVTPFWKSCDPPRSLWLNHTF